MAKKHHETDDATPCYVCGYFGTNMQPLGCGVFRHLDCAPGSERWKEYIRSSRAKRSDVTRILLNN